MFKVFFKILTVISLCGLTNVCFAEVTLASNSSARNTTTGHKIVKSQERIITNEAEYAEMVRDYELARSSSKAKAFAKRPIAASSSSSAKSAKPHH